MFGRFEVRIEEGEFADAVKPIDGDTRRREARCRHKHRRVVGGGAETSGNRKELHRDYRYASRLIAVISLPLAAMRVIASRVFSIAVAMWCALAWTMVSASRAIATWRFQKIRSPRMSFFASWGPSSRPSPSCCMSLSRGQPVPAAVSEIWTRPEQS